MTHKLPYAEDVNYWQTSRTSPDSWMEKAKKETEKIGGQVNAEGFGSEPQTGRSAYMLAFEIAGDRFKIIWSVLPSKTGKETAARIQAATFIYHDVKAKCLSSMVLGPRAAFFSYLMLPDGRAAAEASTPELARAIPELFGADVQQLGSGEEFTEGKFRDV